MAISLEALNAFRPASAWDDNTTLNLNEEGGVGVGGTYGRLSKFRKREEPEHAANNAVRTALLKALGQFEGELDTTTLKAFAIGVLQRQ